MNQAHPIQPDGGFPFNVEVNGQKVPMKISEEALRTHFRGGSERESLHAAFDANQVQIKAKGVASYVPGGIPVFLGVEDFK